MKIEKFKELPLGIYIVYWKSGGHSEAVIGQDAKGDRWIGCDNWLSAVSGDLAEHQASKIKRMIRISVDVV